MNINYSFTSKFEKISNDDTLDFRSKFLPKKKEVEFIEKEYIQVFSSKLGFFPNLSILDLLFCEGPNAISFLR